MFQLKQETNDRDTTFTLDGQILGDCIGVVEDLCLEAIAQGKHVQLYLRDVTVVDEGGWRMLLRLSKQGVEIRASGVYISYRVGVLQEAASRSRRSLVKPK